MRVYCLAAGRERLSMKRGSSCTHGDGRSWKRAEGHIEESLGGLSVIQGVLRRFRVWYSRAFSGGGTRLQVYQPRMSLPRHISLARVGMFKGLRGAEAIPLRSQTLYIYRLVMTSSGGIASCLLPLFVSLYHRSANGEVFMRLASRRTCSSAYCSRPCRQCPSRNCVVGSQYPRLSDRT